MALKAGYVGVKRWLYEKLTKDTANNSENITNLWLNSAVMGAVNLLKHTIAEKTEVGVTWTYGSNGTVIANGTATGSSTFGEPVSLKAGKYLITGCPKNGSDTTYIIRIAIGSGGAAAAAWETGNGVVLTLESDATVYIQSQIRAGYTADNVTFKPMVQAVTDDNVSNLVKMYAPYAMTNQELTVSADDQKTAINAIITAATGAADFAAFKTAMGAITPVTRSAAPETREAIQEEPEAEPVTRKSSKKTTTKKEGE